MDVEWLVGPLDARRPNYVEFNAKVQLAMKAGRDGDAVLAQALHHPSLQASSRFPERVLVAAALGEADGPAGPGALRRILRERKIGQDLRCASLLALAKRLKEEATPDLIDGLSFPDGAVKSYAVIGLACGGDDRAWDAVYNRLVDILRKVPVRSIPSRVLVALAYLGQFSDVGDRQSRVRGAVSRRWDRLDPAERSWIDTYWPTLVAREVSDGHPSTPDPSQLRLWARNQLPWKPLLR